MSLIPKMCGPMASVPLRWVVLAAILVPISASATAQSTEPDCQCAGVLSLVDAADAAVAELFEARAAGIIRSGSDQVELVGKYRALIDFNPDPPPSDPFEHAALGELNFLTFRPREADLLFAALLDRDDLIGRLAWQRAMQIRRQAFERPDEVRTMMRDYQARFAPNEADMFGVTQQVVGFAGGHFASGETDEAIDLIVDHITATPATAPFRAFSIYRFFPEEIAASGRESEVKSVLASKLVTLRSLRRDWDIQSRNADEELALRASAPEWYWTQQRVAPGQTLRAARVEQLDQLIEQLSDYVE
ncbi:hypothetical protein HFP57_09300 [Parasphingopyxis algicola]|uniref:hypothetical protein n=1 Tax=Parasphingopyxis algicola TaxID=2026624 RepID=UPI00159FE7DC|nr:hypothetical protein [Parasphingopyxis algicola]QLC25197.1 hypothetical protein HFP57_09300 [Parasphingopyxis algicola]